IINNKKSLEFEKEIENSKKTLLETDDTSLRYSEKTKVLSDIMLEDFVIAKIKNSDYKNMVLGTVKDLVRWEQKYERAILAAASELMNAMVVNKTEEMAAIAEYVKMKNLPRIKIIPLDIIKKYNQEDIFEEKDLLHIGRLSDFVISKHNELVSFVFGNTVVTRTASDAYLLSKKGYKVVSINGELFDPNSELVTLDFGTKIQDITRDILLSESIEKLRELVVKLKNIIENKIQEYNKILYARGKIELENAQIEIHTNEIQNQIEDKKKTIENCSQENIQLNLEKEYLKKEEMDMIEEIEKYTNRIEKIEKTAGMLFQKINSINDSRFRNQLAEISVKKNQILKTIEKIDLQKQQIMIQDTSLKNEYESNQEKIKLLFDEIKELKEEYIRRENQITLFNQKLDENELALESLRDKEQELIDMSGDSYSVLQNFEQRLKILYDDERRLSKETNTLEKEIALLQKELSTLANLENKLLNDLMWYGHKELLHEDYEVGEIINALEEEFELLKSQINLRASETYVQVIEGYRGMSQRRNELEKERNSIVLFVNEIIKEKESMFIAAFKKVNEDIQSIFSKIIGGSAWLEIENEEDIFGSGVRLVVQFPGKPKRESTSLSGGEKTMAATVFLLALQTIKPSPFYLMDEVDAHLDGQNTERLSNILFERAKNSQIIMVSLKDSLISKVNQVYGVYPKNGVSQLVKYKFPQNYTQDKILSIEQK
ncbi:MAG: chromosome partitioning protein ParA, partial [Nitrososphaeraceae archaeon]|nr:chromosome partitioning protein ParA [Nitrososphaeraceae archaeon]